MADNNIANWFVVTGSLAAGDPENQVGLGGPSLMDVFEITGVSAGSTVSVYLAGLAGHLPDPYLQIFDLNGNQVAWDDDYNGELGGFDNSSVRGSRNDAFVQFTYQPGHVIAVTSLMEPDFGGTGEYHLYLSAGEAVSANDNLFPVIGDNVEVELDEDTVFTFTADDFAFEDGDNDALVSIKVNTLPDAGSFWLDADEDGELDSNESEITVGQEILAADLAKLSFLPEENAFGDDYARFSFVVSDGVNDSQPADFIFHVTPVNDAPESDNGFVELDYGAAYTYGLTDFAYSDQEGDALAFIQITALPDNGVLTLDGAAVELDQEIAIDAIDQGLLVFTAGTLRELLFPTIGFKVSDGDRLSEEQYSSVFLMKEPDKVFTEVETGAYVADGTEVITSVITDELNNQLGMIRVDAISSERTDTDSTTEQADIVLHDDGTVRARISLAEGYGLKARDSDTARSVNGLDSLTELLENGVAMGEGDLDNMLDAAATFYQYFTESPEGLWLNHLTLSGDDAQLDQPIDLVASSDQTEIMVLDLTALAAGSTLKTDAVDLGFVLGDDVSVVTGDGDNHLFGHAGQQKFYLGAGDDMAHGGSGNDLALVALGDDILYGGLDTDTALFNGRYEDYLIEQEHGTLTVTHKENGDDRATLINVELMKFADQTVKVDYHTDNLLLATLYDLILERQADTSGYQWWAEQMDLGFDLGHMVMSMFDSAEYRNENNLVLNDQDDAVILDTLYETLLGRDATAQETSTWMDTLAQGGSFNQVAEAIVQSDELQMNLVSATDWDFLS